MINLVQFLQRLPDQTFAKILAEKVEKQVIAVIHGEAVQQSPAGGAVVRLFSQVSPLQLFPPHCLTEDQNHPLGKIEH